MLEEGAPGERPWHFRPVQAQNELRQSTVEDSRQVKEDDCRRDPLLFVEGSALVDQMVAELDGFAGTAAQLGRQHCGLDVPRSVAPEVLGAKLSHRAAEEDPPRVVLTRGFSACFGTGAIVPPLQDLETPSRNTRTPRSAKTVMKFWPATRRISLGTESGPVAFSILSSPVRGSRAA